MKDESNKYQFTLFVKSGLLELAYTKYGFCIEPLALVVLRANYIRRQGDLIVNDRRKCAKLIRTLKKTCFSPP